MIDLCKGIIRNLQLKDHFKLDYVEQESATFCKLRAKIKSAMPERVVSVCQKTFHTKKCGKNGLHPNWEIVSSNSQ